MKERDSELWLSFSCLPVPLRASRNTSYFPSPPKCADLRLGLPAENRGAVYFPVPLCFVTLSTMSVSRSIIIWRQRRGRGGGRRRQPPLSAAGSLHQHRPKLLPPDEQPTDSWARVLTPQITRRRCCQETFWSSDKPTTVAKRTQMQPVQSLSCFWVLNFAPTEWIINALLNLRNVNVSKALFFFCGKIQNVKFGEL